MARIATVVEPMERLDFRYPDTGALSFEIGRLERMHPMARSSRPHRHSFYEIVWFVRGTGEHRIDFRVYPIAPSTVFFITPGQVQSMRLTGPAEGFIVLFGKDFFGSEEVGREVLGNSPLFVPGGGHAMLWLADEVREELYHVLYELEEESASDLRGRAHILRAHLTDLLISLGRLVPESGRTGSSYPPIVRRFQAVVEKSLGQSPGVSDLATCLNVSAGHLNDEVKDATGQSAGAYIQERTVLEAKRLLLHSDLTVAEIGFQLGFRDPSYFGRYFRRSLGSSPGTFRISSREKYQEHRETPLSGPAVPTKA